MAISAVAPSTALGVWETSMSKSTSLAGCGRIGVAEVILLFEHAVVSMLSYPAPLWQTYFRLVGSFATSSASKGPVREVESLLRYSATTSL